MIALSLLALTVQLELPAQSASAAIDEERVLAVVAGTQRAGVSGSLPGDDDNALVAEVSYAFLDRYLLVGAAEQLKLYDGSLLSLSTALGGSLITTTAGSLVTGAGPEASINLGVGKRVQGVLALSLGAQLFIGTEDISPVRAPARASLGLLIRLGRVRVELWGRGGADFIPGLNATLRYEANAVVGVTL